MISLLNKNQQNVEVCEYCGAIWSVIHCSFSIKKNLRVHSLYCPICGKRRRRENVDNDTK